MRLALRLDIQEVANGGGVSGQVMHLQGSAHTWNRPALTQMKQSSGLVFSEKAV